MITKKCLDCNIEFKVPNYRNRTAKYCSPKCRMKNWKSPINAVKIKKGQHLSRSTEFKVGMIGKRNEENHNWKGDNVGYEGLHRWIKRNLGKAVKCINCGSMDDVQWANISYEYKRDLSDYEQLCRKCHAKKDYYSGHWGAGKERRNYA